MAIEVINHATDRLTVTDGSTAPRWNFRLGSSVDKDHADPDQRNRRTVTADELKRLRQNRAFAAREKAGTISVYGA
jgi:hypothetical protein